MRIGSHLSVAGSLAGAAVKAAELGAETLQIFTSSPRMWRASTPKAPDILALCELRVKYGLHPLVVHDNYLINLASADADVRRNSIAAFRGEVKRAAAIGADYLVAHPGSWKGQTVESAIKVFATSLEEALTGMDYGGVTLLLECTAGQGNALGMRLEELAEIRKQSLDKTSMPVGYCLDTCHLLAAGYDVASKDGLDATLSYADAILGMDHIPVIHSNDSKFPLGSRRDRHDNIGRGYIGLTGFGWIMRHPLLQEKTFILETPSEDDGHLKDIRTLRQLAAGLDVVLMPRADAAIHGKGDAGDPASLFGEQE